MNLVVLLIVILLVLMLVGGLPQLGLHSYGWGPSGGVGLILIVVLIVLLLR